jgi:hypothetical protein
MVCDCSYFAVGDCTAFIKLNSLITKSLQKTLQYIFLATLLTGFFSCKTDNPDLKLHRKIPYPQSTYINNFRITYEPLRYPGTASDMHALVQLGNRPSMFAGDYVNRKGEYYGLMT